MVWVEVRSSGISGSVPMGLGPIPPLGEVTGALHYTVGPVTPWVSSTSTAIATRNLGGGSVMTWTTKVDLGRQWQQLQGCNKGSGPLILGP